MEKCTFCDHRLAEGLEPACVQACPLDALGIEEMEAPAVVNRDGFPETGLRPAVRIVGERRLRPPEMTTVPPAAATSLRRRGRDWQGLRTEWSLWAFTSIITFLAAWFAAATASGSAVLHEDKVVAVLFAGDSDDSTASRSITTNAFSGWLSSVLAQAE